jgi:hypothetical protein
MYQAFTGIRKIKLWKEAQAYKILCLRNVAGLMGFVKKVISKKTGSHTISVVAFYCIIRLTPIICIVTVK